MALCPHILRLKQDRRRILETAKTRVLGRLWPSFDSRLCFDTGFQRTSRTQGCLHRCAAAVRQRCGSGAAVKHERMPSPRISAAVRHVVGFAAPVRLSCGAVNSPQFVRSCVCVGEAPGVGAPVAWQRSKYGQVICAKAPPPPRFAAPRGNTILNTDTAAWQWCPKFCCLPNVPARAAPLAFASRRVDGTHDHRPCLPYLLAVPLAVMIRLLAPCKPRWPPPRVRARMNSSSLDVQPGGLRGQDS